MRCTRKSVTDKTKNFLEELIETKLKNLKVSDKQFAIPHYILILDFESLYGLSKKMILKVIISGTTFGFVKPFPLKRGMSTCLTVIGADI